MYIQDTEELLSLKDRLRVSLHALCEARKDGLRGKDIIYAILNGKVIESYPDRDRVLILGPTTVAIPYDHIHDPDEHRLPLHVVCDYARADEIVAVTVYVPSRARWLMNLIRRRKQKDYE